ncbi:BrnA antitoxin family protein [Citreimonas salinaria]|uniref:BrnA antitoxin of type II toxin-antitoxin system n=1 Tax=Citreimonas salinaria TaxID=321339 RepID=A0A1H3KB36_9RHOB|nr:BrnA antitoxin family protein [Citreimonas salinaria]SDY49412.1 BrnA antitoxin of type II toxin-antitoxin system [Citreimonas salinaria]
MPRPKLTEMTKTERLNFMYGVDAMEMVERDLLNVMWTHKGCPRDWHAIADDPDRRDGKRTRCTVAFDADVVRFFKAMGPGYQHRMNRVLRAFMHFRLAKVIEGPDTSDYIMRPEEVEKKARESRTQWGDTEAGIIR